MKEERRESFGFVHHEHYELLAGVIGDDFLFLKDAVLTKAVIVLAVVAEAWGEH